jgi:hypothetical protein
MAEGSGPEVLKALLAAAAADENKKRRQALEITFLPGHEQLQQPQPQGTPGAASAAAAAAQGGRDGQPSLASDADDDDEDDAGMTNQGDDAGGFQGGYSSRSSQRILEGPAEIAAALGVPLARCAACKAAGRTARVPCVCRLRVPTASGAHPAPGLTRPPMLLS